MAQIEHGFRTEIRTDREYLCLTLRCCYLVDDVLLRPKQFVRLDGNGKTKPGITAEWDGPISNKEDQCRPHQELKELLVSCDYDESKYKNRSSPLLKKKGNDTTMIRVFVASYQEARQRS